jgi:hypothetical protein
VRRIIALITVAAMLVFVASPAQASHVGLHRHLLDPPGPAENIELAQGICKNELEDPALHNVHVHFHEGQPVESAFANNPVDESVGPGCPQ